MTDRPTQQDVMLAILALDAYSRGANPQLQYAPDVKLDEAIGTATWRGHSDALPGAAAVGFSASEYALDSGQKVISYRGNRKRLSENPGQRPRLRPDEWKGGDQLWIIDLVGEPAAVAASLKHLAANELKDKHVKMLMRDPEAGEARVVMLAEALAAQPRGPCQTCKGAKE